jgi:predicted phage terminase large subunit-like protein
MTNSKIPLDVARSMAVDMGRRSFYAYCRLRMPRLYTKEHGYLRELCDILQAFIDGKIIRPDGKSYDKLMLNAPPRHGKSATIILLCQWLFGHDPSMSIITASYNETLSSRMAKAVRDGIQERKAQIDKLVYSDFFPNTKIKAGDAAMQLWSLEGSHFSYLATSPGGTMTGIGGKLMLTDDLIKNWTEANNERVLEEGWDWYQNTVQSRLEAGGKQIAIMTRWSQGDLCGRLLRDEPDQWYVVKKPACLNEETQEMLAPDILSFETFDRRRKTGDAQLIAANYQQEPFNSDDRLYGTFKTYQYGFVPPGSIEAYVDTADEGSDYLSAAIYSVSGNTAYLLDLLYTQESMETTEQKLAQMLVNSRCKIARIESNNGGRGFSRNVERIMREQLGYTGCMVQWFHQSENKMARILSTSTNATNGIIMPHDWATRWPEFNLHVISAARNVKWLHDDAFDMLAGIVEKSLDGKTVERVYDYVPELIDDLDILESEIIHIGQSMKPGVSKAIAWVKRNGILYAVKDFSFQSITNAPLIMREAFPANEIVWYPDSKPEEVVNGYRREIEAQDIKPRIGIIDASEVDRIFLMVKAMSNGRIKICKGAEQFANSLRTRQFDEEGLPENTEYYRICSPAEYSAFRILSYDPDFKDLHDMQSTFRQEKA